MIDTHCHIFSEYYDNIEEIIKKIKDSGVSAIIVNGCDMKSNIEVLELIKKYDIVYGALGFHPTELTNNIDGDLEFLEKNIMNDKIVAIGEIGLDYHYDNTDKEKQKLYFKKQLLLAKKYKKPVIVHSRDSIQDTYNILKESDCIGSLHCYSGSPEMALEFTKIGFYIGVGGIITFKNAKNIIEVIKKVDNKYILLETDSPYLTPEPYRKYKNDPSYIKLILEKICAIKQVDLLVMKNVTTDNAKRLFDIK